MDTKKIAITKTEKGFLLTNEIVKVLYDLEKGLAEYSWKDKKILLGVYSLARLDDGRILKSDNYEFHVFHENKVEALKDEFGDGLKVTVESYCQGLPVIKQNYYIYEGTPFFITETMIEDKDEISSNYIEPFALNRIQSTCWMNGHDSETDKRVLFAPFDNDKWIRYEGRELKNINESYEVTAVYDNFSRTGMVLGSLAHDTWKTGIKVSGDERDFPKYLISLKNQRASP